MSLVVKFGTPALIKPGDGTVRVKFDDGSELPFGSATEMQDACQNALPSIEALQAMAIIQRLGIDPMMDSPLVWDGKTVTLDVEAENPVNVFKVT